MQYRFILTDNNQRSFRAFTWFLFFMQLAAAGVLAFNAGEKNTRLGLYVLMILYVGLFISRHISGPEKRKQELFNAALGAVYAFFWMKYVGLMALLIFAAIYLFILFVQQQKTIVGISGSGVHIKRVFKTMLYPWDQLDNVILKDNILTIDFKSNRIIQADLAGENEAINETDFNRFCKEQSGNKA